MANNTPLEALFEEITQYRRSLTDLREIILANAVMCGEAPSPTFGEEGLVRFLCDRFTESGLHNISTDEIGNATGLIPGAIGDRTILVAAHLDKIWDSTVDHTVSVTPDCLAGPGIADNSLGAAVVASLPEVLNHLGIQLDANLVLLGTTRSLGRGDLAGLRFFLDNFQPTVDAGICIEGVDIGRLSYSSLGMIRGEIHVQTPQEKDWQNWNGSGAIAALNRIVTQILSIEIPGKPKTAIILGSILAGKAYNVPPRTATLRFEVRSEQPGMVARIADRIEEIIEQANAERRLNVRLSILARRKPGGIDFSHPMVRVTRKIMNHLNIKPEITPSTGELSGLVDKGIPGVTLGITIGDQKHSLDESVEIEPIFTGVVQLLGVLKAIDGGLCDE